MDPPPCIQNAMLTKDKKPFTYTPGGLDLSEIKSPRLGRRIERNANYGGVEDSAPSQLPCAPIHGPLPPQALAAMQPQMHVQVLPPGQVPTLPGRHKQAHAQQGPAPPPPPPPPTQPLPTQKVMMSENQVVERPDMTKIIPDNPMALLRKTGGPKPRKGLIEQMYESEGKPPTQDYAQPQGYSQPQGYAQPQYAQPQQESVRYQPVTRNEPQRQPEQRPVELTRQPSDPRPRQFEPPIKVIERQPQPEEPPIKTSTAHLGSLYIPPATGFQQNGVSTPPTIQKAPGNVRSPPTPVTPVKAPPTKARSPPTQAAGVKGPSTQASAVRTPPTPPERQSPQVQSPSTPTLNNAPKPWQKQQQREELPPWVRKEEEEKAKQSQPQAPQTSPQPQPSQPQPSHVQPAQPQPTQPRWGGPVSSKTPIVAQKIAPPTNPLSPSQPRTIRINIVTHDDNGRPCSPKAIIYDPTTGSEKVTPIYMDENGEGHVYLDDKDAPVRLEGYKQFQSQQAQSQAQPQQRQKQQPQQQQKNPNSVYVSQPVVMQHPGGGQRQGNKPGTPGTPGGGERSLNRQQSWSNPGPPTQSNSFKIIQKMTQTDEDDDDEDVPITEHSPRYTQQFQQSSTDQMRRMKVNDKPATTSNINKGPKVRTIPIQIEGEPQGKYVPPSEQTVPEPKMYMGSKIPSRSFKILQAMTSPDSCANANEVIENTIDPTSSYSSYPYYDPNYPPPPYWYDYYYGCYYPPPSVPVESELSNRDDKADKEMEAINKNSEKRVKQQKLNGRQTPSMKDRDTSKVTGRQTPMMKEKEKNGRQTPVPHMGYYSPYPYYQRPLMTPTTDVESDTESSRKTPLPYWNCNPYYNPYVPPYPQDMNDNQNGEGSKNSDFQQYPSYPPYWDPYYYHYYYGYPPPVYSPYPFYPVNSDTDEPGGYSSTDEMSFYAKKFAQERNSKKSNQIRPPSRNSITPVPSRNDSFNKKSPEKSKVSPPNTRKVAEDLLVDKEKYIEREITDSETERYTSDTESDTDTEKEDNQAGMSRNQSFNALQSLKSVTDITVYNGEQEDSDSDTASTVDDAEDSSMCAVAEDTMPHQLSVIYEVSEKTDTSKIERQVRESSVLSETSTIADRTEDLEDEECMAVSVRLPTKRKNVEQTVDTKRDVICDDKVVDNIGNIRIESEEYIERVTKNIVQDITVESEEIIDGISDKVTEETRVECEQITEKHKVVFSSAQLCEKLQMLADATRNLNEAMTRSIEGDDIFRKYEGDETKPEEETLSDIFPEKPREDDFWITTDKNPDDNAKLESNTNLQDNIPTPDAEMELTETNLEIDCERLEEKCDEDTSSSIIEIERYKPDDIILEDSAQQEDDTSDSPDFWSMIKKDEDDFCTNRKRRSLYLDYDEDYSNDYGQASCDKQEEVPTEVTVEEASTTDKELLQETISSPIKNSERECTVEYTPVSLVTSVTKEETNIEAQEETNIYVTVVKAETDSTSSLNSSFSKSQAPCSRTTPLIYSKIEDDSSDDSSDEEYEAQQQKTVEINSEPTEEMPESLSIKNRIKALQDLIKQKQNQFKKTEETKPPVKDKLPAPDATESQMACKTVSTKSSLRSFEELSEEEIDSGVTSDMSRHISDSEEFPELGKMSKYQRAATHSRLFKLLQEQCDDEDNDEPQNGTLQSNDLNLEDRKAMLSLPLKNINEPSCDSSARGVSDKLVNELVQSMLKQRKGKVFKSMSMNKLRAAAIKILQEEIDSSETPEDISSFLSPGKPSTENSSAAQTPQEFYGTYTDYKNYYETWNMVESEIFPSKAFRIIQEHANQSKIGAITGLLAKCPRVMSTKSEHRESMKLIESSDNSTTQKSLERNEVTSAS